MTEKMTEVVIPKESAVFWMDKNGRWYNQHGEFKNRKIRDYFHSTIKKDKNGYYVTQVRGNIREKVYFPYEDTALFVVNVQKDADVTLVLNTGKKIKLDPKRLFVRDDSLYLQQGEDRIKFSDRGLLKISDFLEFQGERYFIKTNGRTVAIPEKS